MSVYRPIVPVNLIGTTRIVSKIGTSSPNCQVNVQSLLVPRDVSAMKIRP
jgi:hypothetical protein